MTPNTPESASRKNTVTSQRNIFSSYLSADSKTLTPTHRAPRTLPPQHLSATFKSGRDLAPQVARAASTQPGTNNRRPVRTKFRDTNSNRRDPCGRNAGAIGRLLSFPLVPRPQFNLRFRVPTCPIGRARTICPDGAVKPLIFERVSFVSY